MNTEKGFATVATGDEKYYKLAYNLCVSYRKRGRGIFPFVLICDKDTKYNSYFDDVVIIEDTTHTTLDKMLIRYSPYDETIFFDADTLILDSVDDLWDIFSEQEGVSAFGCKLPLDSQKGWFTFAGSGKYKSQIKYLISMNGGIYYVKKGELAFKVFDKAQELIHEYNTIDFKYFAQPADEPIMAMAMVLNQCTPCDVAYEMLILPASNHKVSTDYLGNIYEDGKLSKIKLIHFSTPRTKNFLYQYLNKVNHSTLHTKRIYFQFKIKCLPADLKFIFQHSAGAMLRKAGLDSIVDRIKKIIH